MAQAVKVSDLIPKREVRQDAQTIQEIKDECGMSAAQTAKLVKALLDEGRIRKVFKKIGQGYCNAYIPNGKTK